MTIFGLSIWLWAGIAMSVFGLWMHYRSAIVERWRKWRAPSGGGKLVKDDLAAFWSALEPRLAAMEESIKTRMASVGTVVKSEVLSELKNLQNPAAPASTAAAPSSAVAPDVPPISAPSGSGGTEDVIAKLDREIEEREAKKRDILNAKEALAKALARV